MPELVGELCGEAPDAHTLHVGAFPSPRIHGQPVAWTAVPALGPFRLQVPEGNWYIHAVGGQLDSDGFLLASTTAGSYGGIYGLGQPLAVAADGSPVRVHLSPLWLDLTHVPRHRQPALSDEQWRTVRSVIDALEADLASTVDGDLGRAAGLVRTRLSALFKRATGLTMEEYRTRLRLEAAKALLVQSDADVLEVALEVGYDTPAQLGRMFQRYLRVTPGEFRRVARAALAPQQPPAPSGGNLRALLQHALLRLTSRGATVRGAVVYRGTKPGTVIYLCAFPRHFPDTYPSAWVALPGPGPFTLRSVPAGQHYILACYCTRRMRYPGDFYSAFAYGGYGYVDISHGTQPWAPVAITVADGDSISDITVELVDGDLAASFARPWTQCFLPNGR